MVEKVIPISTKQDRKLATMFQKACKKSGMPAPTFKQLLEKEMTKND